MQSRDVEPSKVHAAAKLLNLLLQPSHVALLLLGAGLLLQLRPHHARLGWRMAAGGFALLFLFGFSPLGHAILLPLEERFPRGQLLPAGVDGIILLGGFEDARVSRARGKLTLNENAERLTETLTVARRLPAARIVFSGGAAGVAGRSDGAAAIGAYLAEAGIARERIVLEGRSRNTYENALFTRDLLRPGPGSRWLLVTSASHMPRATGVFRRAGFHVIPWPVDFRTRGIADLLTPSADATEGLRRVDSAAHEWAGLLVYRLLGLTDALWPGPSSEDH